MGIYSSYISKINRFIFFNTINFFLFFKKNKKKYIKTCLLVFLLIIFQGLVGWYMVKSGLVNNVTVSHYRLALHLSIAIIIISTIFWLLKNVNNKKKKIFF